MMEGKRDYDIQEEELKINKIKQEKCAKAKRSYTFL